MITYVLKEMPSPQEAEQGLNTVHAPMQLTGEETMGEGGGLWLVHPWVLQVEVCVWPLDASHWLPPLVAC